MRFDGALQSLAEEQHGVVGMWQVAAMGASTTERSRLRRHAPWQPLSTRVLAVAGSPDTEERRCMAGVLDAGPGAAVSGPSAAAIWGAPGFSVDPVHVVRPKGLSRRPSTLAIVHEVADLSARQLKVLRGIPIVSPSRVVCELAGSHPQRAERVLDRFWADRLLDGRTFRATVEELRDRGRQGSTLFRQLDAQRGPGYVPPASGLESRFTSICPWPRRRQVDSGGEEWTGRVDFRDVALPLIVEVQSERFHTALADRAADEARRRTLEAAGFAIVEVWDAAVWHHPDEVIAAVGAARARLVRAA